MIATGKCWPRLSPSPSLSQMVLFFHREPNVSGDPQDHEPPLPQEGVKLKNPGSPAGLTQFPQQLGLEHPQPQEDICMVFSFR